ncbi:hypothetical protein ACP4OV_019407 [Aristida adscensionis]
MSGARDVASAVPVAIAPRLCLVPFSGSDDAVAVRQIILRRTARLE